MLQQDIGLQDLSHGVLLQRLLKGLRAYTAGDRPDIGDAVVIAVHHTGIGFGTPLVQTHPEIGFVQVGRLIAVGGGNCRFVFVRRNTAAAAGAEDQNGKNECCDAGNVFHNTTSILALTVILYELSFVTASAFENFTIFRPPLPLTAAALTRRLWQGERRRGLFRPGAGGREEGDFRRR